MQKIKIDLILSVKVVSTEDEKTVRVISTESTVVISTEAEKSGHEVPHLRHFDRSGEI